MYFDDTFIFEFLISIRIWDKHEKRKILNFDIKGIFNIGYLYNLNKKNYLALKVSSIIRIEFTSLVDSVH